MKECKKCGKLKEDSEFMWDKRGYIRKVCLECETKRRRMYSAKYKDAEWRKKNRENKDKKLSTTIRCSYGENSEEIEARCTLCTIGIGPTLLYKEPYFIRYKGVDYPFDKDCYEIARKSNKWKLALEMCTW